MNSVSLLVLWCVLITRKCRGGLSSLRFWALSLTQKSGSMQAVSTKASKRGHSQSHSHDSCLGVFWCVDGRWRGPCCASFRFLEANLETNLWGNIGWCGRVESSEIGCHGCKREQAQNDRGRQIFSVWRQNLERGWKRGGRMNDRVAVMGEGLANTVANNSLLRIGQRAEIKEKIDDANTGRCWRRCAMPP